MSVRISPTQNETELAEKLHDAAMDKNPGVAIVGRGMKEIMPVMMRFLAAEAARGTSGPAMIAALDSISISVHVSALLAILTPAELAGCADTVAERSAKGYREALAAVKTVEVAG